MRDEEDRHALFGQLAHDAEELVALLRREHRRGLVQDQDAGVPVERLDDLDALLDAHWQVLDERLGVQVEVVLVRELRHPLCGGPPVEHTAHARLLHAQDDVLGHREDRDEHEMLVHHADAERDGIVRAVDRDRSAADEDLALIRPQQPVHDVHQRALARAVFAQERVDLAGTQVEADVIVGQRAGEGFGDVF